MNTEQNQYVIVIVYDAILQEMQLLTLISIQSNKLSFDLIKKKLPNRMRNQLIDKIVKKGNCCWIVSSSSDIVRLSTFEHCKSISIQTETLNFNVANHFIFFFVLFKINYSKLLIQYQYLNNKLSEMAKDLSVCVVQCTEWDICFDVRPIVVV